MAGIAEDGVGGLAAPLTRVSPDDGANWFFGYYEKSPWDAGGGRLLAGRTEVDRRPPEPGESLAVGYFDIADAGRWVELDRTTEWSWQQGTMLQWVGPGFDTEIVYNRAGGGEDQRPVGAIRDLGNGSERTLPRSVYAIDPGGRHAVSLDFHRLQRLRPGYGYAAPVGRLPTTPAPDDDGVWRIDLAIGKATLIVSLADLAGFDPPPAAGPEDHHWVNHLQYSRTGEGVALLHRWGGRGRGWKTRLFAMDLDGGRLTLLTDTGYFSHYDWRDGRTILGHTADVAGRKAFFEIDAETGAWSDAVAPDLMPTDGHDSYSPGGRWVLNDTYPDADHMRSLYLFDTATQTRRDLGRFFTPPDLEGSLRCDLHPRRSRDGRAVCIDSAHTGKRAIYTLDVSAVVDDAGSA